MIETLISIKDSLVELNDAYNKAVFSLGELTLLNNHLDQGKNTLKKIQKLNDTIERTDKNLTDQIVESLIALHLEYIDYEDIVDEIDDFISTAWARVSTINWEPRVATKKSLSLKLINQNIIKPENIYILEHYKNLFLTNKRYEGLNFFDDELNIVDTIAVASYSKEISYIVQEVFSNESTDYLITCNNGDFLSRNYIATFFDKPNKTYTHVSYENFSVALIPPYLYLKNNQFLLTSHDNRFFIADCDLKSITEMKKAIVAKKFSEFYAFYVEIQKYGKIFQLNAQDQTFIYRDTNTNEAVFHDFRRQHEIAVPIPDNCDYHDIVCLDDMFVFVAEAEIFITTQTHEASLYPKNGFDFLRCRLQKKDGEIFLIPLQHDYDGSRRTILTKYELTFENFIKINPKRNEFPIFKEYEKVPTRRLRF